MVRGQKDAYPTGLTNPSLVAYAALEKTLNWSVCADCSLSHEKLE